MEKRRSIGVMIFGILLLLFAVFPIGVLIRALINPVYAVRPGAVAMYFAMAVMLAILSLGILKFKNWARVVCICMAWIWGISVIAVGFTLGPDLSSEPTDFVILGVLFYALCVFGPVIFFLTRPKVKEQFK